jgi:hypothetical protein
MNLNDAMSAVQGWARAAMGLGVSLIGLFLVVQVIYPSSGIDIVSNIGGVVGKFGGLNGLITLLVLVAIMNPRSNS